MSGSSNITPSMLTDEFMKFTRKAKTTEDLFIILSTISFTIGAMVCEFDRDGRDEIFLTLVRNMTAGFQNVSNDIGQPSEINLVEEATQ